MIEPTTAEKTPQSKPMSGLLDRKKKEAALVTD